MNYRNPPTVKDLDVVLYETLHFFSRVVYYSLANMKISNLGCFTGPKGPENER